VRFEAPTRFEREPTDLWPDLLAFSGEEEECDEPQATHANRMPVTLATPPMRLESRGRTPTDQSLANQSR
jgi:hypothetical protein